MKLAEFYKLAVQLGREADPRTKEEFDAEIKAHVDVVISGHMASDSVGLNLLVDRLEKKGIKVTPFSGYLRSRGAEVWG